eukprot:COSAG06_NODE_39751_length_409_cov_0.819355_2_plen_71_part_01
MILRPLCATRGLSFFPPSCNGYLRAVRLRCLRLQINMETIDKEVQYGTVSGEAMESLLRLMTSVYVPVFNS